MTIATFEDIVAWQKGRELYTCLNRDLVACRTNTYKDQLLRAALSITNNIAEGFDRGTNKELKQFLIIARGSAAEVRSMLLVAQDLNVLTTEKTTQYITLVKDISRLLTGFIKSLQRQNTDNRTRITNNAR